MMKTNKTLSLKSVLASVLFFGSLVTAAWALPSTGSTNLQTTAGTTTTLSGNTLTVTAPNKSVLTWQAFGSGSDAIGLNDSIAYSLPNSSSSVLNIVSGGSRTQIDGSISSNGNVFILNPNGIVVGNGSRIDTRSLTLSTSGDPSFASFYFQQNGRLPVQDGLGSVSGSIAVAGGSIINVTDNISIVARSVDVGGSVVQGGLKIVADGSVIVGSGGLAYVVGNITVDNPTGSTVLATAGNSLISNGSVSVSTTNGTVVNSPASNFAAKSLTVSGSGDINLGKVNSSSVVFSGGNVTASLGTVANPSMAVTANGTVAISSQGFLTVDVVNTSSTATTSVNAVGTLSLGKIHIQSGGTTSFVGSSVVDTVNDNFVYGPVLFSATSGDISITKSGNSFGPVAISTLGNATINESAALNLGAVNVGRLTASSKDYVFQSSSLTSPNVLIVGNGNVTLSSPANNIGTLSVSGSDVMVVTNSSLALNTVTATGNLTVFSTGAVSQTLDGKIKSVGATGFTASGLALTNSGNSFGALSIDATPTGAVSVTEDSTLNLVSLRAGAAAFKSLSGIITSGTNPVVADTLNLDAGTDVTLLSNVRVNNGITVKAVGTADLSLLSFASNLNSKYPSITAATTKAPTP